jgi:hypothetical protein
VTDRDLMKQALDALDATIAVPCYGGHPKQEAAAAALRERLAQPEQEPTVPLKDALQMVAAAVGENQRLRAEMKFNTPPAAAQPTMFGPMGTVGDLFDKHVIANGNLKKEWIVYLEKNT